MKGQSVNETLIHLFEADSIEFIEENRWLLPNSQLPAIRSTWYPNEEHLSGLLQIEVLLEGGQIVEECFAGLPTERGKLNDAFENFSRNSLHVMLSAFWGEHDSDQVEIEKWSIGENQYSIYIGPFANRGDDGVEPRIPKNAFEQIEKAIKGSGLTAKYHWFRTFFCNTGNNENIYEALKDNETWPDGLRAIKSLDWKASNRFYSTRNFIIMIKCE